MVFENLMESIKNNLYSQIIFKIITIFIIGILINIIIGFLFRKRILKLEKLKSSENRRLKITRTKFLKNIITFVIFLFVVVSILFLIPGFEKMTISLLAGAGIAAIIIGFAAQKTLANIVSGFSIAIFTPFRIGDRIKIGEDLGDIEEINLRHTVVRTWDNRRIFVPNSVISEKEIINYSIKEERLLWTINMGISYDSDIDTAKKIMKDLAEKHPDVIVPEIKSEEGEFEKKEPHVRVTECGDFAVNLRLYFWVEKPNKAWITSYDLIEEIKKEFDKQGIEIPFPYRTIVYKKDLEEKKKKNK